MPDCATTVAVLTERERQVLELAAEGATDDAIAAILGLSPHTVKTHMKTMRRKLRARSKGQAVAIAFRDGLLV